MTPCVDSPQGNPITLGAVQVFEHVCVIQTRRIVEVQLSNVGVVALTTRPVGPRFDSALRSRVVVPFPVSYIVVVTSVIVDYPIVRPVNLQDVGVPGISAVLIEVVEGGTSK